MRPGVTLLLLLGPLAVAALRVPGPQMSEDAAKKAWLAKASTPWAKAAAPAVGRVVPTTAASPKLQPPPNQGPAFGTEYEERQLGFKNGYMHHEAGTVDPATNWALGPATARRYVGAKVGSPPAAKAAASPKREQRTFGAAYEERQLGFKKGRVAHEDGVVDPATNWAFGPGAAAQLEQPSPSKQPVDPAAWKAKKRSAHKRAGTPPWGDEYEARQLGFKGGRVHHEEGVVHPATNWALGPGNGR